MRRRGERTRIAKVQTAQAEPQMPLKEESGRVAKLRARRSSSPAGRARDAARWVAVAHRDCSADGTFVFAVRTTGIYCRPSCAARRPKRENVVFYASPADARAAGFRACLRCDPDGGSASQRVEEIVSAACATIETADVAPRLADLAAAAGISAFHFHRLFKKATGLTPKEYGFAHRHERVRRTLGEIETVTAAIMDAGYGSSGRFYAVSNKVLGMTPKVFRSGGANEALTYGIGRCSLGYLLAATTGKGVAAILLGDDRDALLQDLKRRFPNATIVTGGASFARTLAEIIAHAEHPQSTFALPLDVHGTAFQHRVWKALRDIPPGTTATYRDIAKKIGRPEAVRAVAQACGANPAAIAIPCHRVVRTGGALSGYRWGIERKRALLAQENTSLAGEPKGTPKQRGTARARQK